MELYEVLKKIGLSEKEAKVYLALLELGITSAYSIAPKASLKRPITYVVLEQLKERGLVSVVPKGNKTLYVAEDPGKLLGEQNKKLELLKRFTPNLQAIYNAKKEKPQVQLFEGVEGVKLIYNKILESKGAWFFGTTSEIAKLDPKWLSEFTGKIKREKLPVKDLLSKTKENLVYAKKAREGKFYEIRFVEGTKIFPTDSAIFENNVVFFSFKPAVFSVMITSKDISQSMKLLYELAWQQAEK